MVVVYHNNKRVTNISLERDEVLSFNKNFAIASVLTDLAIQYPTSKIIWCHEDYKSILNLEEIRELHHHNKIMLSYKPGSFNFLPKQIGYVEDSLFVNINKDVSYPTWQMSSMVGVIHATVLLALYNKIKLDSKFEYYLNSLAKVCQPLGLLCYSEPKLIKEKISFYNKKSSSFALFKFVKQHYKTRWIFLLFLNLVIYEFKFPFLSFVYGCFFKNRNNRNINLDNVVFNSSDDESYDLKTIDVVIPTIGRKKYLHNVLKDLSQQTHLPKNVIIVEQNPFLKSISELDYITSESWPFKIKHIFINKSGACNARNLALDEIESEWIFFADDDIRFDNSFIREASVLMSKYESKAVTFSCLQKNEKVFYKEIFQWTTFGSGCSIVKSEIVKNIRFDIKYEFGFGEDSDFGMQIRNMGNDVLYFPSPEILHLKAPIGGFRTKPDLLWNNDEIKPKPSPMVMLYKIKHETEQQLRGYKVILFFKFYSKQSIKNPIKYFLNFRKEWKQSVYWANYLNQ
ncbi:glycosyl transferase [Flavobacterium hercynium]|uniref:Glycosyl transferase n=1 Tax=Flavobacterium hercynium TaxID=387094 RepID=A0A226HD96_9FLAO|nr:glycosyl transferase [Flavobacterium hercynium]